MKYDILYASKQQVDRKLWEEFKSRFPLSQLVENVKNFNDLKSKAFTKFFWVVWDDLIVNENFNFDYIIPEWDEKYVHVFLNGQYYDGITIFSKEHNFSQKEFENRFIINDKKEIEILASIPKSFDLFFISYNEKNADENYKKILSKFSRVKRISNIKGIHNAHLEAARLSETDMFWVVDADAEIVDEFNFEIEQIPYYNRSAWDELKSTVHVWSSLNPINDLIYGYGGVKLLPKIKTLEMTFDKPDVATSISTKFKIMEQVSNITKFNTDEFNTWKSSFRECVKLASKVIDRSYDDETDERLETWCNKGKDRPYGPYAIAGARAGKEFGYENIGDLQTLIKINDLDFLKEKYDIWLNEKR